VARRSVTYDYPGTGPVWWLKAWAWNVLVWGPVAMLLILLGARC
jgi:hypothetical protein